MIELPDFEYTPQIEATEANARAIQALTLQDLRAGGFKNPTNLADPDDPDLVWEQRVKLRRFPERYSGYRMNETGFYVACDKTNEWFSDDEEPFADENIFAQMSLLRARMFRGGSLKPKAYGVFSLVASDKLPSEEKYKILTDLLVRSIGRAAAESASVVNIVLHNNDPVTSVATDLGFIPVGRRGEAAGAPGLIQQRYQRLVA